MLLQSPYKQRLLSLGIEEVCKAPHVFRGMSIVDCVTNGIIVTFHASW